MCSSGCLTQDHSSWGECVRSKALRVGYCRSATNERNDATAEKRWTRELDYYAAARRQGIQPESTKRPAVEQALEISNRTGQAYGRTRGTE